VRIRLEDMQFHAYHGVYDEEKQKGNTFLVTVTLDMPETNAVRTDCLDDTVNYQRVYQIVAHEMACPSQLLEHVAGRIRGALQTEWPVATAHVLIKKKNPPVGGQVAWATVEL